RPAERRVELDEGELRHREAEGARELTGDDLGEQGLPPLARSAELEDVEPVVARLDERRQRAAFAQRRDVARRLDPPQRHTREPTRLDDGAHRVADVSDPCRVDVLALEQEVDAALEVETGTLADQASGSSAGALSRGRPE